MTANDDGNTQVIENQSQEGADDGAAGDGENEEIRDPAAVLKNNAKLTDQLKSAQSKITKMEADAEAARIAALSEHEQAIEVARQEGAEATRTAMQGEILQERVRAKATGVLADPEDAVHFIDVADLDMDNASSIDDALEALVKAKPHLAGKGGKPKGIDQGPQGGPPTGETGNDWMRRSMGR